MTEEEFIALLHKSVQDVQNDPVIAAEADAEIETIMLKHPVFFERMKKKSDRHMTCSEVEEYFNMILDHFEEKKMAN